MSPKGLWLILVLLAGWVPMLGAQSVPQRALVRVLQGTEVLLEMSVTFPAYSAALNNSDGVVEGLNRKTVQAVADLVRSKGASGILVEAHSDPSFEPETQKANDEQRYLLIPLSQARAQALVDAMADFDVDPTWFTVRGVGADDVLLAYDDDNSWRNRRIELRLPLSH